MNIDEWLKRLPFCDGWTTAAQAQAIYGILKAEKQPINGVEIGVAGGRSLIPAALAARDSKGGKIIGIDPYSVDAAIEFENDAATIEWCKKKATYARSYRHVQREIAICKLSAHADVLVAKSHEVADRFTAINWLHVDGNHNQPAVKRDLDHYLPRVVSGGLIRLDNCDWEGVEMEANRVRTVSDYLDGDGTYEIWRKR